MRSKKAFNEVFPTFHTQDKNIEEYFSDVCVNRITSNPERSKIDVYIECPHTIPKDVVMKTEKELKNIFPEKTRVAFRLHEKFNLSGQYNAQNLIEEYGPSILCELKRYEPILFGLYKSAQKSFNDEGEFEVLLPDTVIAHNMESELLRFLNTVFSDRCGIDAVIKIDYRYEEKSGIRREAELRVQQEIAEISSRLNASGKASPAVKTANEGPVRFKKSPSADGAKKYIKKKSDDPDVIYKNDVTEPAMPISDIEGEMNGIVIRGMTGAYEEKPVKDGKWILIKFNMTDFTDTIGVRLFLDPDTAHAISGDLKNGSFIKLKGMTGIGKYERELTVSYVNGIKRIPDFRTVRNDTAPVKRTELHCHTKMSMLDSVCGIEDVIKTAERWGWRSIAITDHGSVQAFPIANHVKLDNKDFKIIYGLEGYMVDDTKSVIGIEGEIGDETDYLLSDTYCVFDIETTGFSPVKNRIIEIGAVLVQDGRIVDSFDEFVNPQVPIPHHITALTHITDAMVENADTIDVVLPKFLEFSRGAVFVGHNVTFDMSFIARNAKNLGIELDRMYADTLVLSRILLPKLGRFTLDRVAKELGVVLVTHHRAVDDSTATAGIWVKLCEKLEAMDIRSLRDATEKLKIGRDAIRHMRASHITILAKNETGRVNLYRLVSMSHTEYYSQYPRIPKSELIKHREGLLIGSGCMNGELYESVEEDRPEEDIAQMVQFYDYLEIQPDENNIFLLEKDNDLHTIDDLRKITEKIVALGEKYDKPVCATGDVHFVEPQDEVYRRIIKSSKKQKERTDQPPLYLRTTDEMLNAFGYLGSDKAREVVIENPNLISDMVDRIHPVRPDKCPPVIENSDQMLRDICYKKAHEIYGDELPKVVDNRIEAELNSIIGNGYAVMYIIAQKLVWKSNEDGYLVGSRGSVGSSFAAYLAGITEVNSLPPHYLCPKCHYSDFDSDEVKQYSAVGTCGIDMPDKTCPVCGEKLDKFGFDIPFETFLGFKGDKEPDIDLNFSSEYQSKAHKYVEVIFGDGSAFRAGTMGTVADKTAFGYVKKYCEENGEYLRNAEMERIAAGCIDVLRTTGQHPGGIVVLPHGEEINTFTPVQHPADDMDTNIITTHFEYHSIDSNLLKLDILGHDDPTMIRFLQDLTGVDPTGIPFDDKKVMSLFKDTSAMGIKPEDIDGTPNGSLGLPEFGTRFVIGMLMDAKPQNLSDLIRISGLSHGTDVWIGNADELIKSGTTTLSTCICCRDDIMIYLIGKGMDKQLSFKTMESVRKGKGLTPEMEEAMRAADVPEWYIDSCKKIKYMFPKAHAAAYVMMALRVAWFKVYEPLAYYCAFFSIRSKAFSYEKCCMGRAVLEEYIAQYRKKEKDGMLSDVEANELHDMHIAQEMYARGFEFKPIDLMEVDARYFKIIDGRIMPALSAIEGIGSKAADLMITNIKANASQGPFLSKDDFILRSGASKTHAEKFMNLGILGDIPESNQLSLFDL
ncbi:MAG: PolC-type DNA polymerase III [Lachnospiraceae bacterium]|nr:PolC-type DNA polymerase III [Lachnospiraceae bacterium]